MISVTSDCSQVILDDTVFGRSEKNSTEDEADLFARDSLIPASIWGEHKEKLLSGTAEDVKTFAEQLEISPSIVAGCIQWTEKDYKKHSKLVGHHFVREQLV